MLTGALPAIDGSALTGVTPTKLTVDALGINATHISGFTVGKSVPANAVFTDTDTNTVYTHPSTHSIAEVSGLQTALNAKVDDGQVLTNVPSGALFTDTNTWRGISNSTSSTSTSNSASSAAVKAAYDRSWPNTTYSVGDGGLTTKNFTSTLKTKLDGVETGATADQTAAQLLTKIKTVDGSGSGLDADTLDGQHASAFVLKTGAIDTQYLDVTSTNARLHWTHNGSGDLELYNNRQDLGNVPVSSVVGYNGTPVAKMQFYRGGGGSSGYIRFQNKPTNASSLTDVLQIGDGSAAGYGVNIMDGGLRIGGATALDSGKQNLFLNSFASGGGAGIFFRDGFTYNCSITAEDHNGGAADGLYISGYDGISFGTGSNTKNTRLTINLNGSFDFKANNLTNVGTLNGGTAWHSTNDGSGSGLDADLLDGVQGSGYGRFYNNAVLSSSGSTSSFIAELIADYGCFQNNQVTLKVQWSYAGSSDLVTGHATIGTIELAGCTIETWGGTYKHVRISRPNTGTGGHMVIEYNDQASTYSPGWREIWTSESDGSGSGLDADLLDGQQGSYYYPASNPNGYTNDQTAAEIRTKIASSPLTATHLAAGSVGASEIGNDVVNSQHYANGSIDRAHLAADIIDGTKIANDVINSEHYVAGSIDNEHIADNAINSEHYADNSIDALHLNVSGNGNTSQWLRSDGDGSMSWVAPPSNYAATSHTHSYLPLAGGTMTGGINYNNYFETYAASYTVSITNRKPLLWNGATIPNGGTYRFTAHIDGTGTDNSATAVYWNQGGTWKLNVTCQSGTSSNHPEFIIENGVPTVITDHPNNYTVRVYGERMQLNEGNGSDNYNMFGADGFTSSVGDVLRYNPSGSGTGYSTGNVVWHQGNDGSGSGLDADLLDGQHASAFATSGHAHTYASFGVTNGTPTTGKGISLYGGASPGEPTYGLMFAGTGTFGTHGNVSADWATYFTMNSTANRGWIFRNITTGNVASINNAGHATFSGNVTTGGDIHLQDTSTRLQKGSGNAARIQTNYGYVDVGPMNTSWCHLQTDRANFYMGTSLHVDGWVRKYSGGAAYWHPDNDGSGSGLDADLLDGQQGSSYLLKSGGTMTGNLQVPGGSTSAPGLQIGSANTGFYEHVFPGIIGVLCSGVVAATFNQSGVTLNKPLTVSGAITASGNITAYSDKRLKDNIETITSPLDKVKALRGVTFDKDGECGLGVIAQETEAVIPEVVMTADDEMGTKSVAYGNMVGLLIEAIKEQQTQIDDLKLKLEGLS